MSAAIIPLDFEANAVRVVMQDGEPWFVAADVCRLLEHSNARMAVSRWLDPDEKGVTSCYTLGGAQEMTIVSESGLYALIIRSRTPAAKRFRKWVTAEVLPTIRRTGSYAMDAIEQDELAARRARFAEKGQKTRDTAVVRAEAVARIQQLIGDGFRIGEALDIVGEEIGRHPSTLNVYRRAVRMVPQDDWPVALAHGGGPHGLLRDGSHEAVQMFLDLCRRGHSASAAYRMTVQAAVASGWPKLPGLRSMQRLARRERTKLRTLSASSRTIQIEGAA